MKELEISGRKSGGGMTELKILEQARKPQSYASLKLQPTHPLRREDDRKYWGTNQEGK